MAELRGLVGQKLFSAGGCRLSFSPFCKNFPFSAMSSLKPGLIPDPIVVKGGRGNQNENELL